MEVRWGEREGIIANQTCPRASVINKTTKAVIRVMKPQLSNRGLDGRIIKAAKMWYNIDTLVLISRGLWTDLCSHGLFRGVLWVMHYHGNRTPIQMKSYVKCFSPNSSFLVEIMLLCWKGDNTHLLLLWLDEVAFKWRCYWRCIWTCRHMKVLGVKEYKNSAVMLIKS